MDRLHDSPSDARRLRTTRVAHRKSLTALAAGLVLTLSATWPVAAHAQASRLMPDGIFVQAGTAHDVRTLLVGAQWDWSWQHSFGGGVLSGYWDASWGRWESDRTVGGTDHAWVTQVGITPTLRWSPGGDPRHGWFVEGGIGANVLLPIFQTDEKAFSTKFNFGDHVAVGARFGEQGQHELVLRIQHFSNAGIKKPNPGENFVQLRYLVRF